jgi:dihydroorotate dehydrogenase
VIPLYRTVIRPVLFARESEAVHDSTLRVLGRAARNPVVCEFLASIFSPPALPIEVFGLRFPNPLGLAAGMDKQAAAVPAWKALGFGFCELGGVTWHAQDGNPRPRMFRAVHDEALVNRMGFNNPGAEALARKLAEWRALGRWPNHPVGINLGKSKITPLDQAAADYAQSFRVLRPHADFFVVNVSSPNTPGLRQLQDKAALDEILAALQELNNVGAQEVGRTVPGEPPKPILVKVAPDLEFSALDQILELVGPRAVAGLIATNTTITRPPTQIPDLQQTYAEQGGLSGRPLRERSTEVIRHLYRQTRGTLPIIGVGGVFDADDAWQKISAGASLVQVYTGLVYQGPGITRAIVSGLRTKLAEAGLQSPRQAVGIAAISP